MTQNKSSSTDAAELCRIGYLPGCDKRDPEAVRTFHDSMMKDIPLSLCFTNERIQTNKTYESVDGRTIKPSSWDEVYSLQEALDPSRQSFFRLVGQAAPLSELWDDYISQWNYLQGRFTEEWLAIGCQGHPPNLVMLKPWAGKIQNWRLNQVWTLPDLEPTYRRSWFRDDFELANQQALRAKELHENATQELRQATEAEQHRLYNKAGIVGLSQENEAVESFKEILAKIVMKDPEKYVLWLATKGREHYSRYSQIQTTISWSDYCCWFAPSRFESESHPWKLLEPGRVDRTATFNDGAPIATSESAYQEAIRRLQAIRKHHFSMPLEYVTGEAKKPVQSSSVCG